MKNKVLFIVVLLCVIFCITLAGCGKFSPYTIADEEEEVLFDTVQTEPKLSGSVTTAQKLADMLSATLESGIDAQGTLELYGTELYLDMTASFDAKLSEVEDVGNPLSLLLDRSIILDFATDTLNIDDPDFTDASMQGKLFFNNGNYYIKIYQEVEIDDQMESFVNEYAAITDEGYPAKIQSLYDIFKQEEIIDNLISADNGLIYILMAFAAIDILDGASIGDTLDFYFADTSYEDIPLYWETIADTVELSYDATIYELLVSDLIDLTDNGSVITMVVNNEAFVEVLAALDDYSTIFLDELEANLFAGISFDYTASGIDNIGISYNMAHPDLPGEYYQYFNIELDILALSTSYVFETPQDALDIFDNLNESGLEDGFADALDIADAQAPTDLFNFTEGSDGDIIDYTVQLLSGDLNKCLCGSNIAYSENPEYNNDQIYYYIAYAEPDCDELYTITGVRYNEVLMTVVYDGFNRLIASMMGLDEDGEMVYLYDCYWNLEKTELFELNLNNTYTLVECIAQADQYVIPAEYNGIAVTEIASGAFNMARIGTLTIPASIKSVPQLVTGDYGYYYYINNIILENGVEVIEDRAFLITNIGQIIIPSSVTTIGIHIAGHPVALVIEDAAAANCFYDGNILYTADKTELLGVYASASLPSSVILPSELVFISSEAFININTLTSVSFEQGSALQSIGDRAFYDTHLTLITVPASVTNLGNWFVDYDEVQIVIEEGNAVYYAKDNILYSNNKSQIVTTFDIYNMPAEITLTKELISIPDDLFFTLPPVVYPSNPGGLNPPPTPIDETNGKRFANIKRVTVEDDSVLESIGSYAFYFTEITSFDIPQSVTNIASDAFQQDRHTILSLTFRWLTIPATVETIYISNTGIQTIFITAGNIEDYADIFDDEIVIYNLAIVDENGFAIENNELLFYVGEAKDVVIPAEVTAISETAFMHTPGLRSIDLSALAAPVTGFLFGGQYIIVPDEDYNEYLSYIQELTLSEAGQNLLDSLGSIIDTFSFDNIYTVSQISRVVKASWVQEDKTIVADFSFLFELEEIIGEENIFILPMASLATGLGNNFEDMEMPDIYLESYFISYKMVLFYMMLLDDKEGLYEILDREDEEDGYYMLFLEAFEDEIKRASLLAYAQTQPYFLGYIGTASEVTVPDGVRILELQAFQMAESITKLNLPDSLLLYIPQTAEALAKIIALEQEYADIDYMLQAILNSLGVSTNESMTSKDILLALVEAFGMEEMSGIINLPILQEFAVSENNPYYAAFGGALYFDFYALLCYLFGEDLPQDFLDELEEYQDTWVLCDLPSVLQGDTFEVMEGVCYFFADSLLLYDNITKLSLPSTLQEIKFGSKQFESITVSASNPYFTIENGLMLNAERTTILAVFGSSVIVPNTVTDIESAFENTDIETVIFEEGSLLTSIGYSAFSGCNALTSIVLPTSLISIGSYAFSDCRALSTLVLPEGLQEIEYSAFQSCTSLESVNIPTSVTSIGDSAFASCQALSTIVLTEGLQEIEYGAFQDCTSLESVNIPASVTSIGSYAFSYCRALSTIVLPEGLQEIWDGAFYNCSALTTLSLPSTLTFLGGAVFVGTNLVSLTIAQGGSFVVSGSYVIDTDTKTLVSVWQSVEGDAIIPEGIEYIGDGAFDSTEITSIAFPSTLKGIGSYAFALCYGLTGQIVLPEGLQSLGDYCFYGNNVDSFIVPDSVVQIEGYAFGNNEVILYGAIGSYVETYADYHTRYSFVALGYLVAGFVFEGDDNPYLGYTVKAYINAREDSYYVFADTLHLNFGTVYEGDQITLVVLAPGGKTVFTSTTVVDYTNSDSYYIEIEAISNLKSLTLALIDENDNALTSGYGVRWYQDGEVVSTSKTVSGLQNLDNLYFTVVLSQQLGIRYEQVENVEVDSECIGIIVKLVPLTRVDIAGTLINSGSDPISGVSVLAKQTINGFYCETAAITNQNGEFVITVAKKDIQIIFYKDGYYNETIDYAEDELLDASNDIGNITLSSLDGNTIEIDILYAAARYPQNGQVFTEVATYNDFTFSVFNITRNVALDSFVLSFNTIVLEDGDADADDEILITVHDNSGALSDGSITVTMDSDITASGELRLQSLGAIVINTPIKNNEKNVLFVFDEDGELYGSYTYTGNTYRISKVLEGEYTIVAMGYAAALAKVRNLQMLSSLGLAVTEDYVLASTTVSNGIISAVVFAEIPLLDEDKLMFTEAATTQITLSQSNVVTGNNVSVRIAYTIKNSYTTTGQEVRVQLPYGCRLYTDSIYLGNTKLASTAYTLTSDFVLTLRTARASAKISFNIAPANPESTLIDAYVSFVYENERRLQKIGSAVLEVSSLSLTVPSIVGRTNNIIISGFALPGSVVRVFDNNVFAGSTASYSSGKWQLTIDISTDTIHDIYATIITQNSQTLKTTTQRLIYDSSYPELSGITMYHMFGTLNFDFIDPPRNVPYFSYLPGYDDFTFKIILSNNTTPVTKARIIIKLTSGVYEYVNAKYDAAKGYHIASIKLGNGVPCAIGFEYLCDGRLVSESMPVNAIIDPSGYVYEAVTSNRLENVMATIYYKENLTDIDAVIWNADDFGQANPLYTDAEGNYAWDVPSGWWQVIFEKAGYETAYTDWLPVPPVQENINIGMVATADIQIIGVNAYADYIDIELSQYVSVADNDLQNDIIHDLYQGGNLIFVVADYLDTTEGYSKIIRLTPDTGIFENSYQLSLAGLTSYNSSVLFVNGYAIDIVAEPENLVADCGSVLSLDYGETLQIEIFVDNADGYTVTAISQNAAIVLTQDIQAIVAGGIALFELEALLTGVTTIYIALEGTPLTYQIAVTVAEMEGGLQVDNPTSNFTSGYCLLGQEILLMSEQEGANIYYSTDGSSPSLGSNLYQNPITPTAGLNVKYVAAIGSAYSDILTINITEVKAMVTFRIEGQSDTVILVSFGSDIDTESIPEIPDRTDYVSQWDETNLTNIQTNMVVSAVYTRLLSLTFRSEGATLEVIKIVPGATVVDIPEVPYKQYHSGVWEITSYGSLTEDTVINVEYTRNTVTVTFKAQGTSDIVRSVGQGLSLINIPAVPALQYHSGVWETQSFTTVVNNMTVNAEYTRNQVTLTFNSDTGTTLFTRTVGQGLALTDIPTPPEKSGFTASWSNDDFALVTADDTITCVYTAIEDGVTPSPSPVTQPKSNLGTILFVVIGSVALIVVVSIIIMRSKRRARY